MDYEPRPSSGKAPPQYTMTLLKAVELGEYDPTVLAHWEEWSRLSRHGQFQLVRKGLANKDFQLRSEWAEINNQLNFSKKPHLQKALEYIDAQIQELRREEDRLFVEFTQPL